MTFCGKVDHEELMKCSLWLDKGCCGGGCDLSWISSMWHCYIFTNFIVLVEVCTWLSVYELKFNSQFHQHASVLSFSISSSCPEENSGAFCNSFNVISEIFSLRNLMSVLIDVIASFENFSEQGFESHQKGLECEIWVETLFFVKCNAVNFLTRLFAVAGSEWHLGVVSIVVRGFNVCELQENSVWRAHLQMWGWALWGEKYSLWKITGNGCICAECCYYCSYRCSE